MSNKKILLEEERGAAPPPWSLRNALEVSSVQAAGWDNGVSSVSQDDHYDATRTGCESTREALMAALGAPWSHKQQVSQDHDCTGHWVTQAQDDWTLPAYCKLKTTCANWIRRIFTEFLILITHTVFLLIFDLGISFLIRTFRPSIMLKIKSQVTLHEKWFHYGPYLIPHIGRG